MKIVKRYFDCLHGCVWEKEYTIDKAQLPYYIQLNNIPQSTSHIAYSDLIELESLNPEDTEYIHSVYKTIQQKQMYSIEDYLELYKDIPTQEYEPNL